jgi:hypothetical protein
MDDQDLVFVAPIPEDKNGMAGFSNNATSLSAGEKRVKFVVVDAKNGSVLGEFGSLCSAREFQMKLKNIVSLVHCQ